MIMMKTKSSQPEDVRRRWGPGNAFFLENFRVVFSRASLGFSEAGQDFEYIVSRLQDVEGVRSLGKQANSWYRELG